MNILSVRNLKKYYKMADVFVLPTREDIWGLVVNEAMAYGLPVVTTDKCNAGLELIQNGENGYIVSTDNYIELEEGIRKTLDHSLVMGNNALLKIGDYTIERMAVDHIATLQKNGVNSIKK